MCMYMYISYVCFVFGSYRSAYSYVVDKMIKGWKTMGTRVLFYGKMVNIDHFSKDI